MSTLASRNRNSNNDSKWRDLMPHRLAWKGCLLLDDAIHRGVTKTAEKIERATNWTTRGKFPLTRRRLAYLSLVSSISFGGVASLQYCTKAPCPSILMNALLPNSPTLLTMPAIEKATDPISEYANISELVFKVLRFPTAIISTCLIASTLFFEGDQPGAAIRFLGLTISAYLASSSNGMLDRAKKAVKDFVKKAKDAVADLTAPKPAPELIPIPVCGILI